MILKMRKIHKYVGLGTSIIIIIVSLTGILLIHKKALGLNKILVNMPWYSNSQPPDVFDLLLTDDGKLIAATRSGVLLEENREWKLVISEQTKKLFKVGGYIYACSKSGIYESMNGRNWQKNLSGLEARNIVFNGNEIYAVLTNGVYKKKPGDASWEIVIKFPKNSLDVRDIAITKDEIFIAAREGVFIFNVEKGLSGEKIQIKRTSRIELQKLITDLHTGEFFGSFFYILMDISALGLIALTITGIYIWYLPKKMKKKIIKNV